MPGSSILSGREAACGHVTESRSDALTVCFTPGGNCSEQIVNALGDAKSTILVQAYSFTSAPIAKVLLEAHKRGVQVQVILDKSQRTERYSSADFLTNQGVPTIFAPETQAAIWAYQARYGVEVTGLLDRTTRRGLLPGFDQRPFP